MIRVDLHVHTAYSSDASIQPKTLVDQLFAHPHIKAVAITDHNTVEGYQKIEDLAASYPDILIIPGVEIRAIGGDLIVLGVTGLPPKPYTIENVIGFAKENDGLVVAPHPFREYGLGDLTRNLEIDAIEVLNGISSSQANKMARKLSKTMGLPGVAGSDAHRVVEMWSVYTEVQASLNLNEVLNAIRKGHVKVASKADSIHFKRT